jgi:hypothetical protein
MKLVHGELGQMALVAFQVIDGVDKGRCYEDLPTPVTLGREEGNVIRLNDERVSRFHAKIQEDHDQVVLTDLDSTNGTSVNGEPIQLRILRPGDQISIGRSKLVFGSPSQIAALARGRGQGSKNATADAATVHGNEAMITATQLNETAKGNEDPGYPKLPNRLAPAQAAQLSEVIDFLHRALADAADGVQIPSNGREARMDISSWQQVQAVLAILARYSREVAEPDHVDSQLQT